MGLPFTDTMIMDSIHWFGYFSKQLLLDIREFSDISQNSAFIYWVGQKIH